ncbi:PPE domain-containing protein [Mycobacterium sp.]|uniref:PPE family protein n=1 Tax=Mycobacterium sp. TaxID=1785 RepID=UPI003A853E00
MMSFAGLPPEINSLRMRLGAGSAPMLAAAAAWNNLAEELGSAASSFSSVTSNLTGQAWQGPAAAAMANAAAPYSAFLQAASTRALGASGQANAVASAFETAKAAMINPEAIAANRNAFAQLVRSNFLGLNAPMIAAAEGIYEEFWAADVAAMFGYYGGASTAATQLSSWEQALQGLPVIGALLGGGVAGTAESEAPDYGAGNKGGGNIGAGNTTDAEVLVDPDFEINPVFSDVTIAGTGAGNNGFGNNGSGNTGSGNRGIQNLGNGNFGAWNIGAGNIGTGNIGFGNSGIYDHSDLLTATPGHNNIGLGNSGDLNQGIGNSGVNNLGLGNTGVNNIGFGLTGENLIGFGGAYYDTATGQFHFDGNTGTGNLGLFNSGTGNIGFFNSGDGNVGLFNSGTNFLADDLGKLQTFGIGNSDTGNIGFGNGGVRNVGFGNGGILNTGNFNAGDGNTGDGNGGKANTGNFNAGLYNTFDGNSGNSNTGSYNSGGLNTGSFFNIDGPLESSGYGNDGPPGMSGFGNIVGLNGKSGNDPVSGFYNNFPGGSALNGAGSGWFNTPVPESSDALGISPPITISGFTTGYFNTSTLTSGYFNFAAWLRGLTG